MTKIDIQEIIKLGPTSYSKFDIDKSEGGKREINAPNEELKLIQKVLVDYLTPELKISPFAVAYRTDDYFPPREFIKKHLEYKYTVALDIKNFFPSIKERDVKHCFKQNGILLSSKQWKVLCNVFFMKGEQGVPMGSCASPWLSNVVMYEFDILLNKKLKSVSSDYYWDRYSDNLYISCNSYSKALKIKSEVRKHIYNNTFPKFRVNEKKTKLNYSGQHRKILGVILTIDERLTIGGKKKKITDNLLHKYNKVSCLDLKSLNSLQGYLGFAKYIDDDYWNRILCKYGQPLINKIHKECSNRNFGKKELRKISLNPDEVRDFFKMELDL